MYRYWDRFFGDQTFLESYTTTFVFFARESADTLQIIGTMTFFKPECTLKRGTSFIATSIVSGIFTKVQF